MKTKLNKPNWPINQTILFMTPDASEDPKAKTIMNDINVRDATKRKCLQGLKYALKHPKKFAKGHIEGITQVLAIIKALEIQSN